MNPQITSSNLRKRFHFFTKDGKMKEMENVSISEIQNQVIYRQNEIMEISVRLEKIKEKLPKCTNPNVVRANITSLEATIQELNETVNEFRTVATVKYNTTLKDSSAYLMWLNNSFEKPQVEQIQELNAEEVLNDVLEKKPEIFRQFITVLLKQCDITDYLEIVKEVSSVRGYRISKAPTKEIKQLVAA